MALRRNYFDFLQSIAGDSAALRKERTRLSAHISQISRKIRSHLTSDTVPGILWDLAIRELHRMRPQVDTPVSDFTGHARFLRSMCASVPFGSMKPIDSPPTEQLLALCRHLWSALLHRDMLQVLEVASSSRDEAYRRQVAATTSLLDAVQRDLSYSEQVETRTRALYEPFTHDIIEPCIGLSVRDVLAAFSTIREKIESRVNDAFAKVRIVTQQQERHQHLCARNASVVEFEAFELEVHASLSAHSMRWALDTLASAWIFTVADLETALGPRSENFFNAFSFLPGTVNAELESPSDANEVEARPFARLEPGRYALIDGAYFLTSAPIRLQQCFDTEQKTNRLVRRRSKLLEEDADRLFRTVLDPDTALVNYYVGLGENGSLVERDLLYVRGDCVVVVECKSTPLRSTKGRGDTLSRIAGDVKRSIRHGYEQASSVIRHLMSSGSPVQIFDSDKFDRRLVTEVDPRAISIFLPVVLLDAYYGVVATDLKPWLDVDEAVGFPWAVDRDTFETIASRINTPEMLVSFLTWRRGVQGRACNEDEATFAGYFLRHGPDVIPAYDGMVQLSASYADVFDHDYFRRLGVVVKGSEEAHAPPVMSQVSRKGRRIVFEVDGRIVDSVSLGGRSRRSAEDSRGSSDESRVGRNSPCPCGSGIKYKKCCARPRM